jgi:hypothetical protein
VWSQPHGQATASPGHVLALSCDLSPVPDDQPNEVSLELCVGGFARPEPLLEAAVGWSYPGQLEADAFSGTTAFNAASLARLDIELPNLLDALRAAVRRGRPRDMR